MTGVPPLASIVIVTYGKRHLTEACLASLDAALGDAIGDSIELVLVDNASPDDTPELLRAWNDRATVLLEPFNRNFAGGCNDGAAAARSDTLIFLNNDTVVGPGVLEELARAAREPGVGAVGARLLYPDGLLQHGGVLVASDGPYTDAAAPAIHLLARHDGELPAARACYELDVVTGACLAMPRDVFEELGGFDEDFANGWEDVDLCFRVRVSGRRVVYRGDLAIEHHEGATRAGMDYRPNLRRFLSRWGAMLEADRALARDSWDAELTSPGERRLIPGGPVVVAGDVTGFGPAADEARALILALDRAGAEPVAVDLVPARLRPAVGGATGEALERALTRLLPHAGGHRLDVPFGAAAARLAPPEAFVRAPGPVAPDGRTARVVSGAPAVDASAGAGPGGGGLLISLPAHDVPVARAILRGVAEAAVAVCVRVVPTVGARGVADVVASLLPGAELLTPCGDEAAWAALAATADVALCLDADDRFERRALTAAAAGATVVLAGADGPAGAVLGELAVTAPPPALAVALPGALAVAQALGRRDEVHGAVAASCDPQTVGRAVLAALSATAPIMLAAA